MDKITYLAELAEGLARWVPERERQNILRYYAEYFEEAGPDREAEVVAELGDPWALSSRLAVEGGYVTHEKAASWTPGKTWPKILIGSAVGLSVFALVCGIGLLVLNITGSVFGFASNAVSFTESVPRLEQAAVVDWGYNEYYASPVDDPSVWGVYFIDGESIGGFEAIDIDISLGNVEVVAGDGYTISIRRSEGLTGYEPAWEVNNGVLRLRDGEFSRQIQGDSVSWVKLQELFSVGAYAVDVTITVPQDIFLDKISVKTGLGNVLLYGLNAESVIADTGLGDVECYEARNVGRLVLNTGMGDVCLGLEEALNGLNIGLETGMGNIEATLCGAETDWSYTLESGMGCVTVNGGVQNTRVVRRGNQPYQLNANSGMGDVSVYFIGSEAVTMEGYTGFFFSQTD